MSIANTLSTSNSQNWKQSNTNMVQRVPNENLPKEGSILANLVTASKCDKVILSFVDGRALTGGLLVNPIQRTGLLYNLAEEIRIDWRLEEIAGVEIVA